MFKNLFAKKYHHLNKISIDRSALEHNFQAFQSFHPEAKISPVLKSNAYGHGLKTVAPIFDELNPAFLVVDSLYEAYELAKLKVRSQILILGYTHPENFAVKQLPFHVTVFDLEVARSLNNHQKNCNVHLFIDTGMSREGVPLSELAAFVKELKKLTNLKIVGLASHFADADNAKDSSFTERQVANYKKGLAILKAEGIAPQYRHISASGGAFKITDDTFNMVRVGLGSYGINPLEKRDAAYAQLSLKPALRFTSTLAQIKTISKGEKIGYNGTFTTAKNTKVGLLPLGYYEGIDRRLSNNGLVTIHGVVCPILGRVSMNMTTVDISKVPAAKVGDEVVIYSDNPADVNSISAAAEQAGTIPYELLVQLAESVKREVV